MKVGNVEDVPDFAKKYALFTSRSYYRFRILYIWQDKNDKIYQWVKAKYEPLFLFKFRVFLLRSYYSLVIKKHLNK